MKNDSSQKILILTVCIAFVCAIMGGACFGLYAKHKQVTTYTASRSVLISHPVEQESSEGENNTVQNDLNMMPTYKGLVNDYQVARLTHQALSHRLKTKYSVDDVQQMLGASTSDQSLILKVNVKSPSAKDASAVVNVAAKAFVQHLSEVKPDAGKVVLLGKHNDLSSQTKPHAKKYAAVGFILGGLIGLVLSILWFTILGLK